MEQSENLNLPYIMPSQAQKHVTHNEAIRMLDALVHLCVESKSAPEPALSPEPGTAWIVPQSGTTGIFVGHEGKLACYQDSAWAYYQPQDGHLAYVKDEENLCVSNNNLWATINTLPNPQFDTLGIATSPDDTNKLAVAAQSSLFTHATSGDHRLNINKANTNKTASILLQSNYSGRSEIGLAGNDDLTIKVSTDGTTWQNAMKMDGATAAVLKPKQPAFFAKGNTQIALATSQVVIFNNANLNKGNSYNITTGKFTVPVDGVYAFHASIHSRFIGRREFYFRINDNLTYRFSHTAFNFNDESTQAGFFMEQLLTGDTVDIYHNEVISGGDIYVTDISSFSGYLIG